MLGNNISEKKVRKLTSLELSVLVQVGILSKEIFEGASIKKGVPVYDLNGEILFYRHLITKGKSVIYSDVTTNPVFGSPLLAVSYDNSWNEKLLLKGATSIARQKHKITKFDNTRFVAYSYPKIAVQFLKDKKEILMLELYTWIPVPEESRKEGPPGNFERWSVIKETPSEIKERNTKVLKDRILQWEKIIPKPKIIAKISAKNLANIEPFKPPFIIMDSRELHYSLLNTDHHTCYELRGQLTNVWCVAASVHMLLDFYRYNYDQTRIASELGLGTLASPSALPYSREGDVVTVIEKLTSNALAANMDTSPNWNEFRDEIRGNRPLISFIPGHSRTVAGYTSVTTSSWYSFRGLLVYDPWPPTTGVITRWENFDAQTYRRTFTAKVTLV